MENIKRSHDIAMQNLESTYNEKLILEYTKYLNLEDKLVEIRKDYEKQIDELKREMKNSEALLHDQYNDRLKDKDIIIEEVFNTKHLSFI